MGLVACLFVSCSKDVIENPANEETYTVQLGWSGEIDINYEPLTKATGDDLYGIQVYSTPDLDGATTETPYAYGLFDNPQNITITLLRGYKYKFVATLVKDGKNKIKNYSTSGFYAPFYVSGTESDAAQVNNAFSYTSVRKMNGLKGGNTMLSNGTSYSRPNTDRYYGELDNYIPGKNNNKAIIKMIRTSYGAKFQAKGTLAKSGKLEVMMAESPSFEYALTDGDNIYTDIFTFSNVYNAWNSTGNEYSETVKTSINWYRADGTVIPLGTHEITFKRNVTTIITVEINDDDEDTDIGFDIDEEEMVDGDEVTIKDGEMVKTEITPGN